MLILEQRDEEMGVTYKSGVNLVENEGCDKSGKFCRSLNFLWIWIHIYFYLQDFFEYFYYFLILKYAQTNRKPKNKNSSHKIPKMTKIANFRCQNQWICQTMRTAIENIIRWEPWGVYSIFMYDNEKLQVSTHHYCVWADFL